MHAGSRADQDHNLADSAPGFDVSVSREALRSRLFRNLALGERGAPQPGRCGTPGQKPDRSESPWPVVSIDCDPRSSSPDKLQVLFSGLNNVVGNSGEARDRAKRPSRRSPD